MMNHFNLKAKDWDSESQIERNRQFSQAIMQSGVSKLEDIRLLDFGCGTGLLTSFLIDKTASVFGLDNTPEMIDLFNQRFQNIEKVQSLCADIEENPLCLSNDQFDLIVTAMAFHHLKRPLLVLKNLQLSMTRDSQFILIDLDQEDGSFHSDPAAMGVHHFGFSAETLKQWAQELKFSTFESSVILTIDKNDKSYPLRMSLFKL